ncbi:T-cell immunoreceptor with Ig and ITIM domains isoform X1 [Ochotona princeps]|uniref:T-cell immunoreceptor with Ig and ITIM domains isoform X1 n=1 Tax=Ochotona princeps TaxID=9978 RepID=UPI0027149D8F|nr:T-cell immunoreceptor with Ig and ITIM domains isoform X1 [Ochotona princeps]
MRWCFLLIWAQGLRQAPLLTSGMIVTAGNLSAEEGGSAILQCHLSSITAEVTQVNWEQQDQLVAIRHADFGWHVSSAFRERVVPGPNLGLTLLSLTANDTGEYFCIYHTYPHGIYKGRIFLEVRGSSVAEQSIGFQIPLLAALATLLVVLCVAVVGVVALAGKVMALAGLGTPSPHQHSQPQVFQACFLSRERPRCVLLHGSLCLFWGIWLALQCSVLCFSSSLTQAVTPRRLDLCPLHLAVTYSSHILPVP